MKYTVFFEQYICAIFNKRVTDSIINVPQISAFKNHILPFYILNIFSYIVQNI